MQPGIDSFYKPNTIVGQVRNAMNENQPVLTQVSQNSPLFNPSLQTPQANPMPQKSPMRDFAQGLAQGQPQTGATGQPSAPQRPSGKSPQDALHSRADLIVRALTSHLAQLDKMIGQPQQNYGQPV